MFDEGFVARLQRSLGAALPRWGLPVDTQPALLAVSENATFRVSDAEIGQDLVFPVHRPGYHMPGEIASELARLAALRSDGVIDTLTPILQAGSELIAAIDDHGTRRLTAWMASHSETPTARQLGAAYTDGTVRLARDYLAGRSTVGGSFALARHQHRALSPVSHDG